MKKFKYVLYIRTQQQQEFNVGTTIIDAKNVDDANKIFNSKCLPFHHFSTVECLNKKPIKIK